MACSSRAVLLLFAVGVVSALAVQPVMDQNAWVQPLEAQNVKVRVQFAKSNGATASEPDEEDLGQYLVSNLAARNGQLYKMRLQKIDGEPFHSVTTERVTSGSSFFPASHLGQP